MNLTDLLDIVKTTADFIIVPLCMMIWSVQGRISKIEGKLETLLTLTEGRKK